jgi:hypothetical protein
MILFKQWPSLPIGSCSNRTLLFVESPDGPRKVSSHVSCFFLMISPWSLIVSFSWHLSRLMEIPLIWLSGFRGKINENPLVTSSNRSSLAFSLLAMMDVWLPWSRKKWKSVFLLSSGISFRGKEAPFDSILDVKFRNGWSLKRCERRFTSLNS